MQVVNESRVDFQYRFHSVAPIISKTIFSNLVTTVIVDNRLKVEKKVDKTTAGVFDILVYTINASNISNLNITNVFLKDLISENTRFIQGSIKINGVKKRCVNPNKGFTIGTIAVGQSLSIEFKVVVLQEDCFFNIKNHSDFTYDYIYNIEKPPVRITERTNTVCTSIENKLFKQFNISNIFKLPVKLPLIQRVKDVNVEINILNKKIVDTPIVRTKNNNESNLCNLIIIGSIKYSVLYEYHYNAYSCVNEKNIGIEKLTSTKGFSTFILVPCGIQYCENKSINMHIENVSNVLLNKKSILIDTEMLLNL